MSSQMILPGMNECISSPELEAGSLPCDSPDGAGRCGQAVAPASRTARRANAKAMLIPETYGLLSFGSSASAALQSSLASRLALRFGTGGSMEYAETWKLKATLLGRQYWEHTASGRRTSGNGCTGWPTPQTHDTQEQGHGRLLTATGRIQCHNGDSHSANLPLVAKLAGWPTPKGQRPDQDSQYARGNPTLGRVAGWASPMAQDHSRGIQPPRPQDTGTPLSQQVHGLTSPSSNAETAKPVGSVLNPAMSRWLMGFPVAWGQNSPGYAEWRQLQDAIASGG